MFLFLVSIFIPLKQQYRRQPKKRVQGERTMTVSPLRYDRLVTKPIYKRLEQTAIVRLIQSIIFISVGHSWEQISRCFWTALDWQNPFFLDFEAFWAYHPVFQLLLYRPIYGGAVDVAFVRFLCFFAGQNAMDIRCVFFVRGMPAQVYIKFYIDIKLNINNY